MARPNVLLVHGAWHGSWFWEPLRAELGELEVHTVDLPSCVGGPDEVGDLWADVAAVEQALSEIEGPVVVVAHSYGGLPVTEAAVGRAAHLVYLCAFMLDAGESLLGAAGGTPPPWWEVHERHIVATTPVEVFYNDLEPGDAAREAGRLGVMSRAATEQTLTRAAWRDIPSTYVVCRRDAAIPVVAQEAMAARAGDVVHIDAGHSAALSRPGDVAAVVRAAVETVD